MKWKVGKMARSCNAKLMKQEVDVQFAEQASLRTVSW
jgi:hypothetical protein